MNTGLAGEWGVGRGAWGQVEDGASELDQLGKVFTYVGTPTEASWPGCGHLLRFVEFEPCSAAPRLLPAGSDAAAERLTAGLLTLDPNARWSPGKALASAFFQEPPLATAPGDLPR